MEQDYFELLSHRVVEYNGSLKISKALHGRAGLMGLGSRLGTLETNNFVLLPAIGVV